MKLKSKIAAFGSVAALIASPLALADGGKDAGTAVEVVESEPSAEAPGEVTEEVVVPEDKGDAVTVEDTEGSDKGEDNQATVEPGDGDVVEVTGEVTDSGDGGGAEAEPVKGGVPLDWVKRGGEAIEDPNVIFYNMAGGGAPPAAAEGGETPMFKGGNPELGQDEKGSAIEAKGGAVVPRIQREKKGPVALVKKGHVFLR